MLVCVIGMSAYLYVDGHRLLSSVLNLNQGDTENSAENYDSPGSIEKSYNYTKVKVIDYKVDGGSIVFNVEDQKVGYVDRYLAKCVNKNDPADVRETRYNIPSVEVYGLLEDEVYTCYVAIERDGKVYGKSRAMNIKTGNSSYDNAEVAKTDSSFDSITLEAKNQFIDYKDLYYGKCFVKGTRDSVETNGGLSYENSNKDTDVIIAGLDQNKEYDCYMAIEKADGTFVNESEMVTVKTKIGMTNVVASDTSVTLEVDDQKISPDDFYFGQCTMKDDVNVVQKAFGNKPKVMVEGLVPETEYQCFVGVENAAGTKTRTNDVTVKTLENPYGEVEIVNSVLTATMIEFEVKDLTLTYRDFYVARCENTQNKDLVYVANSKYPKIRVRDLVPSQEYQCVVSVEMPTRTVGESAPVILRTPNLDF
jgi:hypothetical protein